MRLRPGETARAEMADILSQRPAQRSRGVWPRGAHVRRTLGTSKNPLSSRKTRGAPSRSAFFYMGPLVPHPMSYGLLVPFPGAFLRFLTAPPQAPQKPPQVVRVVLDVKLLLNYFRHAALGPQVRGVSVIESPFQEDPGQGLSLPRFQLRGAAGDRF